MNKNYLTLFALLCTLMLSAYTGKDSLAIKKDDTVSANTKYNT